MRIERDARAAATGDDAAHSDKVVIEREIDRLAAGAAFDAFSARDGSGRSKLPAAPCLLREKALCSTSLSSPVTIRPME